MGDLPSITFGQIKEEFEKGLEPLHIHIVRKKTMTEHDTFLGQDGLTFLRLYVAEVSPEKTDALFPLTSRTVETIVKTRSIKVGIAPPVTPHRLRSFFKTYLTLIKVPEEVVEYWMGHRQRYSGAYMIPPVDIDSNDPNFSTDIPSQRTLYKENEWVISISERESI